jgi:hypothetical protein
MMIGGEVDVVKRLDPIFAALAPGVGMISRTPGREKIDGTAELGYLHCGRNGAGLSSRWSTTVSNTARWRRTRKDLKFCVRRTLESERQLSMPRRRRCAIPSAFEIRWTGV